MSDASWYYAHGEEESGPVSSAELKSLAQSGQLEPEDLVWKDGMDDWVPATEVRGLFSSQESPPPVPDAGSARADDSAPPPLKDFGLEDPLGAPAPKKRANKSRRRILFEPFKHGKKFGQPTLLVGLLFVLLARGCDAIGNRGVARLESKVIVMQADLTDTGLEALESTLLQAEITELEKDSSLARHHNQMWGYWREMLFVLGSIVLSVGLLATGFTGEAPERWICLIMLAIVTFSLYVGGMAWISSMSIPGLR